MDPEDLRDELKGRRRHQPRSRPRAAGTGTVGRARLVDRCGRQSAAGERGGGRRAGLRRHAARRMSRSWPATRRIPRACTSTPATRRSGVASGVIEVRRDGQDAWQPLPTQVTAGGLSAFLDDEVLPKGPVLPARARDQRRRPGELRRPHGRRGPGDAQAADPARQPPAWPAAAAIAGAAATRGHRRCRLRLADQARARASAARRACAARLTVAGKAMPGDAAGGLAAPGSRPAPAWARIGTVTTSKTRPVQLPGAPRPGTHDPLPLPRHEHDPRPQRATSRLRVRAGTDVPAEPPHRDQRRVRHLRGHLKGGWLPAAGVAGRAAGPHARRSGARSRSRARTPRPAAGATGTASRRSAAARASVARPRAPPARLPVHHRQLAPGPRPRPRPVTASRRNCPPAPWCMVAAGVRPDR